MHSPAFTPAPAFTTRPTLTGTFGMSASTHWLATATAQSVLERGGNAFDAAVAAGFVLHVVEPHLNGPGGDLVGVFATAEQPDRPQILMGQGPAPREATIRHYRGLGLDLVPGAGALAAAVPGAVDAWLALLERHGTWELADVLAYAIGYLENGHPVLAAVSRQIQAVSRLFTEDWPTSAALWLREGRAPRPGSLVTNPEYAAVLRRLASAPGGDRAQRIAAARKEWSEGEIPRRAEEFVRTPHRHSDGGEYAGVITAADFAGPIAGFEPAVTADFRGYTVATSGAWGQGPVLLQALKILEGFDDERLDPSTELGVHTILEALKLALADRDAYYGEALGQDELAYLVSAGYAAQRRGLIGDRASAEFRPGGLPGRDPVLPPLVTDAEFARGAQRRRSGGGASGADAFGGVGEPTLQDADDGTCRGRDAAGAGRAGDSDRDPGADPSGAVRGDTCHLDVADRFGNMISVTPSGSWLQSSPTIPGLGFCLGTRLQMSWLDERHPAALRPGGRPRTTLTPTLVLKDGEPVAAVGTPGGDQQSQWQLLLLLRMLVGGYEPQQAIDAPALHTTAMPSSFWPRTWQPAGAVVEDRLGEDVISGLEDRGHRVTRAGEWALGRLSCVVRDPATGVLRAAANPRGAQGYAAGR